MPRPPRVRMGRPMVYDWEGWFSDLPRKLVYGEDYFCLDRSIALQARNMANRYRRKISVYVREGYVFLKEREEI